MGETLPSVPSLRHGRDPNESRAGTSGRSNSLYSVLPQQLTLLAVPPGCESCTSNQSIPRLLLLCCLISFVLLGLQFLDGQTLEVVLLWIDKEPLKGSLLFIAADIIGVTVLFPGAIFAMAGGAIFGVGYGSLLVWIATSLGQTLAFMIGRYLLRGMVVSYLSSRFPKWTAVDAALSNEGWKLITLLRLSPVVPWNVLNYALSVTGVGLLPYALSSALAIIPWSITFVYFGSMAKSMADILEGRAGPHGASSVVLLALSGVMLVAVVVYSTIIARRAIREALSKGGSSNDEELQSIVVGSSEDGEANMGSGMNGKGPGTCMSGVSSEASSRRSTATERQEGLR